MRPPEEIIKRPLLTEKGTLLKETGGQATARSIPRRSSRSCCSRSRATPTRSRSATRSRSSGTSTCCRSAPRSCAARRSGWGASSAALELEEGHRDHRAGREHRILRGSLRRRHGSSSTQRHHPRQPRPRRARLRRAVAGQQAGEVAHRARCRRSGGRNNHGRITSRFRGGGHKRRFRVIDFRRNKVGVPAKVATVEYDPNRTARIALLHYADGEKRYILCPDGLKVGDVRGLVAQRRHQAGQHPAAAVHPARHRRSTTSSSRSRAARRSAARPASARS